jgi:sulfite exporter TauE/SafE
MTLAIAIAGLLAGFVHVLSGPDHLAAIAPYAVEGKTRAWQTGVRWGVGHSAGVLGVGVAALVARHAFPLEALSAWAERGVGIVLIAIGVWGLRKAFAPRSHVDPPNGHGRAALAVGTVHGLAGSSHLLGIVPALALPTDFAAAAYLALFGAGTVAAMGTFSSLVGWISSHRRASAEQAQRVLLAACAACAIAVGAFWLLSDLR